MEPSQPIRVLIVDDSTLVRGVLTRILADHEDIEVVAGATDPIQAMPLIATLKPDVIILDLEMPRMDGLTFLSGLRRKNPVPVIVCSGAAPANSHNALEAIARGAIDVVCKPQNADRESLRVMGESLADKIRAARKSRRVVFPQRPVSGGPASFASTGIDARQIIIAIGASTGGTEALKVLLDHVSADFPPIAIVQHMPEAFTGPFAQRLDRSSPASVSEAVDGEVLQPGRVVVARGGTQMRITGRPGYWRVSFGTHEPVNRHCPSVDVLFDSVAAQGRDHVVGVILTGMGADGAAGLKRIRQAGGLTIGQNRESCVVYGMPKAAAELGAVEHTASPEEIPRLIVQSLHRRHSRACGASA